MSVTEIKEGLQRALSEEITENCTTFGKMEINGTEAVQPIEIDLTPSAYMLAGAYATAREIEKRGEDE